MSLELSLPLGHVMLDSMILKVFCNQYDSVISIYLARASYFSFFLSFMNIVSWL